MNRLLWIMVALAFVLRLLFIGHRQLGTEELMQALVARADTLPGLMASLVTGVYFPAPLDYLIQRAFLLFLPESEWALRLHAAILGSLAVWVFARLALLLFGARVAAYSTTLFALYPLAYHYSQEGRPHALFLLLTLLSYELLLRRVAGRHGSGTSWWLLGIVLLLLLYTSFLAVAVIFSQVAALSAALWLVRKQPDAVPDTEGGAVPPDVPRAKGVHQVGYLIAAGSACLLFLPWAMWAFSKPGIAPLSEVFYPGVVLRLLKEVGDNSFVATGLMLAGAGTGIAAMRRHGRPQALAWLLTWFLTSVPAVMVLAAWSGYFFGIAHVLHATPPLVLLAGYGLSYVGERMTILPSLPYRISSPAILYGALWLLVSGWIGYHHWSREIVDWKGAAMFLQGAAREGDALTAPKIRPLLEFHAPALVRRWSDDLDPGVGTLQREGVSRRFVACYQGLRPDPCASFRAAARKDAAWSKREFRGIEVFMRRKP